MQEEIYNSRDRSYSAWHRRASLRRFVGIERAQTLVMIDLDASLYVEYDDGTKEPLALFETAMDRGQLFKPATVTTKLAERAGIPAYVVLYKLSGFPNSADPQWMDIESFRVKRLRPKPDFNWRILTPAQWANAIVQIRFWSAGKLDSEFAEESVA